MEWAGLSLGLLGVAIGIIPLALANEVPQQLHVPLWCLAVALLIAGFAAGIKPLRKPIALSCRLRFGRYPFLFVYLFADMFVEEKRAHQFRSQARLALQGEYMGEVWCKENIREKVVSKVIDAAKNGRLHLYGRLATDRGVFRFLTKIPPEHIRTHKIETFYAMQKPSNEDVFSYDPNVVDKGQIATFRIGCYCDLYVSRQVKMLLRQ